MRRGLQFLIALFAVSTLLCGVLAQDIHLDIMHHDLTESELVEAEEAINEIGSEPGQAMNNYRNIADGWNGRLWMQIMTGIMNWDTIPNYLVFVVQFLSDLGLVVGVIFIMYAGYKYMLSALNGGKNYNANDTLKNAIIGVIIVIFSYAILKTMTALIGIS